MSRRAVVTGIGVVTAHGLATTDLGSALARSAPPPLAPLHFPAAGFPHELGACAPPRRELARLLTRRKDLKLMTADALLAVAAGVLAWEDAQLDPAAANPESIGVFLGVGTEKGEVHELAAGASAAADGGRLDPLRLARQGLPLINPLDSLKTLPNMALAHLSIRLGLQGPTLALSGSAAAGEQALIEAAQAIANDECDVALAGAADCFVSFAGYVQAWRMGWVGEGDVPGEAAAVLVLEEAASAAERGVLPYLDAAPVDRAELQRSTGVCGVAAAPLALAAALADAGRRRSREES